MESFSQNPESRAVFHVSSNIFSLFSSRHRSRMTAIGKLTATRTLIRANRRQALCTLAHRTPFARPVNPTTPTKAGSTAIIAKIQQRTAQVAQHLSASSSFQEASSNIQPQSTMAAKQYSVRTVAAPHTLDHRIYIEKDGIPVSPFHDIPLYANEQQTILNMVVEIPRWTNAKQEVRYIHSRA